MDLIRKTARAAFLVLPLLAAVSMPFKWKLFPLSILVGGVLALVNMRGLARGVEGFLGSRKATGSMIFFSMFRLFILFVTLILLVSLRLVNVFGILVGLTTVFVLLLIEGYRTAKHSDDEGTGS
jgi:hypothetical protein